MVPLATMVLMGGLGIKEPRVPPVYLVSLDQEAHLDHLDPVATKELEELKDLRADQDPPVNLAQPDPVVPLV
jgi:hypothetical protein